MLFGLSTASGVISITLFATVIGASVRIASAGINIVSHFG